MISRAIEKTFFPRKLAPLGLVLMLLMLVLLCGFVQAANHSADAAVWQCDKATFLVNSIVARDSDFLLGMFLLPLIVLIATVKSGADHYLVLGSAVRPTPAFLKVAESIPKLRDPILKAFRRGILHPQIYHLVFNSS